MIAPTEALLADARAGRMVILVDDENRENEGDLVLPAQFATPEAIAFMMREARGLICLALTPTRVERLGLEMMALANQQRHQTAFTVSIDARDAAAGVTARDRARTIAAVINPETEPRDLVTPGHVFPLAARPGGVLVRAGHTEAAVDIARLAGLIPAGVICEILNEDGTMARLPQLAAFAQFHDLRLGTIADLIATRRRTERLVHRAHETEVVLDTGRWRAIVYTSEVSHGEHVVLVKGAIEDATEPVLVRMQAVHPVEVLPGGRQALLMHAAMRTIEAAGRGVMVVLHDWRGASLMDFVTGRRAGPDHGNEELRSHGVGAQILADLGVHDMILLSNTERTIVALEGYGLNVVARRGLSV